MKFDCVSVGSWAAFDKIWTLDSDLVDGGTAQILLDKNVDKLFYGDCSFNVAVAANNLGLTSGVVSVVGQDFETTNYSKYLQNRGIDISGVTILPSRSSGINMNISMPDGTTFCITKPDASLEQDKVISYGHAIESTKWLIVNEKFSFFALHAVQKAKKLGAKILINGAIGNESSTSKEILSLADIFVANECEFAALKSNKMVDLLPSIVVKTLGKQGVTVQDGSHVFSVETIPTDRVIDTTGAGDSLVAGIIAGIVKGFSLKDSVKIGVCTASLVIEEIGCQSRVYDWSEVFEIFKSMPLKVDASGE